MPNLTSIFGGYQRASRFNPVEKRTLLKAYKPYQIKMASLRKKKDSDLRRMAVRAVLKKRGKLPNTSRYSSHNDPFNT